MTFSTMSKITENKSEIDHTLIVKLVNHCFGKCLVRCSSTIARRGENNRRAFSIATALEGKTTTFLRNKWRRKVKNVDCFTHTKEEKKATTTSLSLANLCMQQSQTVFYNWTGQWKIYK